MGMWSKKVAESKTGDEKETGHDGIVNAAEDSKGNFLERETPQDTSTRNKVIDWEERHFRICLALLGRDDVDNKNPQAIILRADKMVEALKKHHEEQNNN